MSLCKVLLVDDEHMVLKALSATINWNELGCCVIGQATDGESALQELEKMKADIVITDINMPKLSGIELIKRLHEKQNACKMIVISGYARFDYAQEAIKYGVSDYLLKPFTDQDIKAAVLKAKRQFDEKEKEMQSKLFQDCIFDNCVSQEKLAEIGIDQNMKTKLVVLQAGRSIDAQDEMWQSTTQLLEHSFTNMDVRCFSVFFDKQLIVLLLCKFAASMPDPIQIKDVLSPLLEKPNAVDAIGVGCLYVGLKDLHNSYESLTDSIDLSLLMMRRPSQIIYEVDQEHQNHRKDSDSGALQPLIRQYGDALMLMDHPLAVEALQKILGFLSQKRFFGLTDYKLCVFNLILGIKDEVSKIAEIADTTKLQGLMTSLPIRAPQEIINALILQTDVLLEQIKSYNNVYSPTVQSAITYIQHHYREDLGLYELSEKLNLSSSYLSATFHKEVGEGVIAYINRLKIEESKILLSNKNRKIMDIAIEVGFNSTKHFTKTFRKYEKITPSEYRDQL